MEVKLSQCEKHQMCIRNWLNAKSIKCVYETENLNKSFYVNPDNVLFAIEDKAIYEESALEIQFSRIIF